MEIARHRIDGKMELMNGIVTARLQLRRFRKTDAAFVIGLVNDEGWLRYIGDRGIRTREEAVAYIETLEARWAQWGYGAYVIELAGTATPVGMAGLFRREGLGDPDIGFALLSDFRGQGYAWEASAAVLEHAWKEWGLTRIAAVTVPDNRASIRLLKKLGLGFVREVTLPGGETAVSVYEVARDENRAVPRKG